MATPKKIDWELVDSLLEAGCTGVEIAATIGIHHETLYKRCGEDKCIGFAVYLQQKRASGDRQLRKKQFDIAIAGDKAMLIWLGKNRLGQSDADKQLTDAISKAAKNIIAAADTVSGVNSDDEPK